jgi:hypothetical protein
VSTSRSSSTGSGKISVEFRSADTSAMVDSTRSCIAAVCSSSTTTASPSVLAASFSPRAWMTLARRSRSASAWRAEQAHQLASQAGLRQAARQLGIHRDALKAAFGQWGLPALERRLGWQPSRFLTNRAEAERAFAWAKRLGSINATAAELGPAGRC